MNYNVTLRTLPERYCATVRMTIPRYQDEGMVWDVLCRETAAMALVPDDPCYCAVEFLDNEFKETNVEIMASKSVKGTYPDTEHVKFQTLPAVTYAGCTFGFIRSFRARRAESPRRAYGIVRFSSGMRPHREDV